MKANVVEHFCFPSRKRGIDRNNGGGCALGVICGTKMWETRWFFFYFFYLCKAIIIYSLAYRGVRKTTFVMNARCLKIIIRFIKKIIKHVVSKKRDCGLCRPLSVPIQTLFESAVAPFAMEILFFFKFASAVASFAVETLFLKSSKSCFFQTISFEDHEMEGFTCI